MVLLFRSGLEVPQAVLARGLSTRPRMAQVVQEDVRRRLAHALVDTRRRRVLVPARRLPGHKKLGLGRHWHFLSIQFWILTGVVYVVMIFTTGYWHYLVPTSWSIVPDSIRSIGTYLQFNIPPTIPGQPFESAQKLAYFLVILVLAPLQIATGAAMSPSVLARFPWYGRLFGGKQGARSLHFLGMCAFVRAGEHHDLVLDLGEGTLDEPVDVTTAWQATEQAWREAVPPLENTVAPADTRHSYAVLRGLTTSGGGMVAAATTSPPERADAGRNYDYRYFWIHDQWYTGQAIAAAGAHLLLDDATRFVSARLLQDGPHLTPAYTPSGGPVPDQRQLGLPGYPGGHDLAATGSTSSSSSTPSARHCCSWRQPHATTTSTTTADAPSTLPSARSSIDATTPTPVCGRSTTAPGHTAGSSALPARARSQPMSLLPARQQSGLRWPTPSSPKHHRHRCTRQVGGNAHRTTQVSTGRCSYHRSGAHCTRTTRERSAPCRPTETSSPPTTTPTGSATMNAPSIKPKVRSCCAAS